MKVAKIKPAFKEDSQNDKKYTPYAILFNISKIYERLLYKQLETYFESILSQISVWSGNGSVCIDHSPSYDREMERIA